MMNDTENTKSTEAEQRKIFDEYFGLVYTTVHGRVHGYASREDIEECVSDVFAEIFLSLERRPESITDLKGFIRMTAVRRAIDLYRRLSPKTGRSISAEETEDMISPDDTSSDIETSELRKILMDRITALGEPDSSMIIRRYYFGDSSAEIAKSLSVTDSAVRKRCSKALARLKKELKELGIDLEMIS